MNDEFIQTILVNRLKFLVLEKQHSYNYEDIILKCKRTVTHRLKKNETIMMPNIDRLLKNMNFKELKTLLNKDSFKNEIINKY